MACICSSRRNAPKDELIVFFCSINRKTESVILNLFQYQTPFFSIAILLLYFKNILIRLSFQLAYGW